MKVCIDAGHGLPDVGATRGNKTEAEAVLSISMIASAFLRSKGVEVKETRPTMEFVSLERRCKISNDWGADCFVSIHLNASTDKSPEGVEVFKYQPSSSKTESLARNTLEKLAEATGAKNRGIKDGSKLFVLKHTNAPAVLVECGFISNDRERELLFTPAYQVKIAVAISEGILKALGDDHG